MVSTQRTSETQGAVGVLRDGPSCFRLERVMADTEVSEVGQRRRSTVLRFLIVVDLTPHQRGAAPWCSAVLVARREVTALGCGGAVSIDLEHGADDRIAQHAVPARRASREKTGGGRIDGAPTRDRRAGIGATEQGEHRHRDLHLRADRTEPAGARDIVRRIDGGRGGEEEVGTDVGADLGQRAVVTERLRLVGKG